MKKVLLIIAGLIVVVVIALTVLIKVYVTPDRIKGFIVPAAEASLNRKVDMGEIQIGLVKGIGLSDFSIKEADKINDFVKFKEFVLKFKLLPLLSKNLIIDELRLVSPAVNVVRGKDGKYNFEDIGKKKEAGAGETPDEAGGLPVSLLVNKIAVQDARFSLSDLTKELPDLKTSGDIDISIKSLEGSDLFTEGSINITVNELDMKKPSQKPVKDLKTALTYALKINLESLDTRIDSADLNIQGIPASIAGDVKNVKTSPEVNLAVKVPKVKTSELQKLAALFSDLGGLNLSGDLAADVRITGAVKNLDTLRAKGSVLLEQVGITYDQMNALLDGSITFDEKLMNINLRTTIDKNIADITGSVKNYMKNQDINLNVYSQKLFLDQVVPVGKPASGGAGAGAEKASQKNAEPLDLKLKAQGEIKIDTAVYQGLEMTDFAMQYVFKDNKLDITKMTAKAGKGTVNLTSSVDLSKPGYLYRLSGAVDSLHADEFVNALAPKAKDTLFGILSLNLNLSGAGTLPERLKQNLVASGDFNISEGRITGAKITESLSRFLSIDELKTINLKEAKGTITAKNGNARLDSTFSSDQIQMNPAGNIGLDETLDLAFDLKLAPRLTDKAMSSKIAKYIKSEEGWGTIPLIVKGTFSDPAYSVDIAKAGKQVIEKKVDKYLDKLLDKQDEEKKKQLEPVKDLLKGIFK